MALTSGAGASLSPCNIGVRESNTQPAPSAHLAAGAAIVDRAWPSVALRQRVRHRSSDASEESRDDDRKTHSDLKGAVKRYLVLI